MPTFMKIFLNFKFLKLKDMTIPSSGQFQNMQRHTAADARLAAYAPLKSFAL